jgi:hypothetical protein
MRCVPPKCLFTQDLHGATSHKTAFFEVILYCPRMCLEGLRKTTTSVWIVSPRTESRTRNLQNKFSWPSWRWVVSFTPRPLYSWRKFLTVPGLELRPIRGSERSQSLYRLSYPGCHPLHNIRFYVIFNFNNLTRLQRKAVQVSSFFTLINTKVPQDVILARSLYLRSNVFNLVSESRRRMCKIDPHKIIPTPVVTRIPYAVL